MSRFAFLLVAFCALSLAGCGIQDIQTGTKGNLKKIIGKWEMVENLEHPRHNPPTETIEFAKGGGFVMRMNGKVEMEGSFRIENDKLILTHLDGETRMGDPANIKSLTADSLILGSGAGRDTEFVRQ
jgi:uncharacterized protein (TIGR03066 family)